MDKEKIFFTICSFTMIAAITVYSVSSEKPDEKPVVSTYISYDKPKTVTTATNKEKSEMLIKYPIDINFATKEELCSLDGIGDVLSDRIIEYRKENYFYSVEDIMKVNGIGENFLKENNDKIFVDVSKLPEITTTYLNTTSTATTSSTEIHETTPAASQTRISETVVVTTHDITTEISETEKGKKRVNLNTATYEELTALPIPPEIAKKILRLRDRIGYFSSTEELYYIEDFSRELYIELLKYVYV